MFKKSNRWYVGAKHADGYEWHYFKRGLLDRRPTPVIHKYPDGSCEWGFIGAPLTTPAKSLKEAKKAALEVY